MNDDIMKQPPKLKLFKLKYLLLQDENLKQKNNNKTERLYPKLKLIQYASLSQNNNNNNKITNSKKSLENVKKKNNRRPSILPYIAKENKNKKKLNNYNLFDGYNSYLKVKTNKAYMKMNRLLMEQTLKRLSLPKYRRTKRGEIIIKEKSKISNDNEFLEMEIDDDDKNKKLNIEKKHKNKNYLFEKEKMKCREKYKLSLKNNFKELENCEKKFDIVIDKTLKLFTDYKFSLSNLKSNEK